MVIWSDWLVEALAKTRHTVILWCCVKQNSCVEIWGRVYKLIKGNIKVKRIREICDQGEVQLLFSFSLVAERASNRQKLRF